jgi:hypothetical protein
MKANKELTVQSEQAVGEDDNIEKVRDILFGVQVREFERKFSKLEQKFEKEVENLRNETREKLDKLEAFMGKEVNALTDKIYVEQDERGDAFKKMTTEMQNSARDLEKQISKLAENTAKNETDIRAQILDQSKTMSDSIQKKQEEVMFSLEKEAAELRDDKADRAALADLFTEMAMRLNGDFKLPKSK